MTAGTRSFEFQVGGEPNTETPGSASPPEPRAFKYERLMQVFLRHNYYNRSRRRCLDFKAMPTPASAALMKSLGLLFKDEGDAFSVFYDCEQKDGLISYLQRAGQQTSPPQSCGPWTWLSFVLLLQDSYFVNFTDIPLGTDPAVQNFYFTNQQAHGHAVLLNRGRKVSGSELIRTTGPQYIERVDPKQVKWVVVRDISGEIVICEPVWVPVGTNPAQTSCRQVRALIAEENRKGIDPLLQSRDTIYLDFSFLPEGKYCIQQYGGAAPPPDCQLCHEVSPPLYHQHSVLYNVASGSPLCFIDLLLNNPEADPLPGSPGVYPVRDLYDEKPRIQTINYKLKFGRRSTTWRYYIVPTRKDYWDLRIKTIEPRRWPGWFNGPEHVRLPNGQCAQRFVSNRSIPLQEQSVYNFQLWGNDVPLTPRLPVASNQQVIPKKLESRLSPDNKEIYSQIYVYV